MPIDTKGTAVSAEGRFLNRARDFAEPTIHHKNRIAPWHGRLGIVSDRNS